MFLAIVFIIIGLCMLLNALGLVTGSVWGIIWAVVVLAIGVRLLLKKGNCPMCGWNHWERGVHQKMHNHCDDCNNDHDHN